MRLMTLERLRENEWGTFGVLIDEDVEPFCLTLEPQWFDNKEHSCIPEGEYACKRDQYNAGGYQTFEITNVPNRSHILFHKGNFAKTDTLGCVLLGEEFGKLWNPGTNEYESAVMSSGRAFQEFMERLKGDKIFKLIIRR